MKKCIIILAVFALIAPALAQVDITLTEVSSDVNGVWISVDYSVVSGALPRAFALDITAADANIFDVGNYFVGECIDDANVGYGIFPASFSRRIDAGNPNWGDAEYTPAAESDDYPLDTKSGIGTGAVTFELGSLYDTTVGSPFKPATSGTLFEIRVDGSTCISIALNAIRGGITLESGVATVNLPTDLCVTKPAPEPDVCLGDSSGGAGIPDGQLSISDVTRAITLIKDAPGLVVCLNTLSPEDEAKYTPADCSGGAGIPDGCVSISDVSRMITFIKDEPGLVNPSCICLSGPVVVPCP